MQILVLYWMCWADSGTCSKGEALCALRQQWVCGSLSVCDCSRLSVTESTWDGLTKTFCVVATAWWMCSTLRSRDIDAGASGSPLCFIWLLFHLARVAGRLGFVWSDAARMLSMQSPVNFLVRKVMFLYHCSHKKDWGEAHPHGDLTETKAM